MHFFETNKISFENCSFTDKHGTPLLYKKIGSGSKVVLLANGVGTNLFMWLPTIRAMQLLYPTVFKDITLICPCYRGLFNAVENPSGEVEISIVKCVEDFLAILNHLKLKECHAIIGWSLGAQITLTLCALHPNITKNLFLLNPSSGETLHSTLQPFTPLPRFFGNIISYIIKTVLKKLKPVIDTNIFDIVRRIAYSSIFHIILVISAFLGGFPPEQPIYFHEYVYDLFNTREHTKNMLELICALDDTLPNNASTLPHNAMIISGIPDIMTGVYHAYNLHKNMKNSKHIVFTMGSHFLLMEWPEELASYILIFLLEDKMHNKFSSWGQLIKKEN